MELGFIGLGRMGGSMAARMLMMPMTTNVRVTISTQCIAKVPPDMVHPGPDQTFCSKNA